MAGLQIILIFGGLIAFALLLFGVVVSVREEKSLVEERLGRYLEGQQVAVESGKKAAPLTDWLNTTTEQFSWGDNLAKELARADIKLKVGEYIAAMVIVGSALAIILWLTLDKSVWAAAGGFVLGLILPRIYVGMLKGRRLKHFDDQLSDMLNLMVNGLRAGYSTMQAMEAVSKELPPPICDEFRRVVQEMQLGVPMENALENLIRRIPSLDLDLVVTAINVQREVGGNLAEILDTISHTIRERVRIKGEIQVLTSQVVYSGRFLSVLPLLILGAMYLLNKAYIMRFFAPETRLIGLIALGAAAILIISGSFVMDRLGRIDV